MAVGFSYPLLFCLLIVMYGRGDAAKDLQEKHSSIYNQIKNVDAGNESSGNNVIGSAEVGLFTMDDLLSFHAGTKLPIFFPIRDLSRFPPFFLPKKLAKTIPFPTSESSIFKLFSVSPSSPRGKAFLETSKSCELKDTRGEAQICATSLDSMLRFVRKGSRPDADFDFITTTHPTITTPLFQNYTLLEPPLEIESEKKVPCHPLPYFYAVYFCHADPNYHTRTFRLRLVGDSSGDRVEALVVCHLGTKNWSSKHVAFRMLGIQRGDPFCHVFRQGDVVWIQTSSAVGCR